MAMLSISGRNCRSIPFAARVALGSQCFKLPWQDRLVHKKLVKKDREGYIQENLLKGTY